MKLFNSILWIGKFLYSHELLFFYLRFLLEFNCREELSFFFIWIVSWGVISHLGFPEFLYVVLLTFWRIDLREGKREVPFWHAFMCICTVLKLDWNVESNVKFWFLITSLIVPILNISLWRFSMNKIFICKSKICKNKLAL